MDCIFCKIINKEVNSNLVFEDDKVVVFDDLHPRAPTHKLIVPKQHISDLNGVTADNAHLMGHIILTAKEVAKQLGIAEKGYRLISNCGVEAGQSVFHIHFHLLGGRPMGWPPG